MADLFAAFDAALIGVGGLLGEFFEDAVGGGVGSVGVAEGGGSPGGKG